MSASLTPEEKARLDIDRLLSAAGWEIQDRSQANLGAAQGVAVREVNVTTGFADYMLFVDRKAAGVVEAKAAGEGNCGRDGGDKVGIILRI